jgi:hypothetical protein
MMKGFSGSWQRSITSLPGCTEEKKRGVSVLVQLRIPMGRGKPPEVRGKVQRGRGRGWEIVVPPGTSTLAWEVQRYTEVYQAHNFGNGMANLSTL